MLELMASSEQPLELSVEDLVGRAVHELRTPLGAILMWAHALRDGSDADRAAAINAIEAAVHEQGRIMSDLMDLVRARAGRLSARAQPIDLQAMLDELVAARFEEGAQGRIVMTRPSDLPNPRVLVRCDPKYLRQALEKVIARAVRRCRSDETVAISVHGTADTVEMTIEEMASPGTTHSRAADDYRSSPWSEWTFDLLLAHALIVSQGGNFALEQGGAGRTVSLARLRWSRDRGAPQAE
jgi:signal transduction histidine kinase